MLDPESLEPIPGAYTAGWIKLGPSGIAETHEKCANETVASLFSDLGQGRLPAPPAIAGHWLGSMPAGVIDLESWRDGLERPRMRCGASRVKLVRTEEDLFVPAGAASDTETPRA